MTSGSEPRVRLAKAMIEREERKLLAVGPHPDDVEFTSGGLGGFGCRSRRRESPLLPPTTASRSIAASD